MTAILKQRGLWVGLALLAALVVPTTAGAEEERLRPDRYEFGGTPVLNGDSDIGFGFGALISLARFRKGYAPYRWRAELLAMMTVREASDGGVELPYHDYYLKLDLPGLLGGWLRLDLVFGFSRFINSGYYGMGNASPPLDEKDARYHQYDRTCPQAQARARIRMLSHLSALLGAAFIYNRIRLYQPSRLADDLRAGEERTRDLLRGAEDHLLAEMIVGWVWDSRDQETAPSRGLFSELSWRFSPGTASLGNLAYGGLNLTARGYRPLAGERLVLAGRLMLDLLTGTPPFYELAAHGGLFPKGAIGGGNAVRGVPLQRYHGKIKLLGNLELRSKLLPFVLWGQRFNLGATLFADLGRSWADYGESTALDGQGAGFKVGLGGGPRLQWGETFLLRADLAWSPDARPVGIYVDVNHAF